jgi:hypothetical protein
MQRILVSFLTLVLISVLLLGCGGGTTGSGDSATQISGQVKNAAGNPIAGAQIQVIESGESTRTDQDGHFNLQVISGINEVTLAVSTENSSGNISGNVLIADLPMQQAQIEVQITVDSTNGSVKIDSVSIEIEDSLPTNTSLDQTAASDPINQQNNVTSTSDQNQSIREQKPQKSVLLLSTYKPNGDPLKGVLISVLSGTGSGRSNSAGKARISTEPSRDGKLSLRVSISGVSAKIDFSGLPVDKAVRVLADLVIDITKSNHPDQPDSTNKIIVNGKIVAISSNGNSPRKTPKPNKQEASNDIDPDSNRLTITNSGQFQAQAARYEDF